jgi:hypothetical protein
MSSQSLALSKNNEHMLVVCKEWCTTVRFQVRTQVQRAFNSQRKYAFQHADSYVLKQSIVQQTLHYIESAGTPSKCCVPSTPEKHSWPMQLQASTCALGWGAQCSPRSCSTRSSRTGGWRLPGEVCLCGLRVCACTQSKGMNSIPKYAKDKVWHANPVKKTGTRYLPGSLISACCFACLKCGLA